MSRLTDMFDSSFIPQIIESSVDNIVRKMEEEKETYICNRLIALDIDKDILINQTQEIIRLNEVIAEYERLEEQGLLLRLPCKVGSTLYQPINSHVNEYKVIGLCFDIFQNKWMYEVAYEVVGVWNKTICDFEVIGKTVFLTKEEAEQALKQMGE